MLKQTGAALPATLEALHGPRPDDLLSDPFADAPFRYERQGDGFRLWSLWSDLDDDDGKPLQNGKNGDMSWDAHEERR